MGVPKMASQAWPWLIIAATIFVRLGLIVARADQQPPGSPGMNRRTLWYGKALNGRKPGSFTRSLLSYRQAEDRVQVADLADANLVSSRTTSGWHRPILDLDFPHRYVPSTTPGHGHLYLDIEVPRWRWILLMLACRIAGVCEHGYVVWSLRRGANFVRVEGVDKAEHERSRHPEPVPDFHPPRRRL